MTNERFKELLDELDGNSVKTLAEKNARYSADSGDALHNFKNGAEILGGTPAQACWGYMTKHLVALRDKVERNDFSDKEDFLEKCQDTINYIRFLWCIGNEETEKSNRKKTQQKGETLSCPYEPGTILIRRRCDEAISTSFSRDLQPVGQLNPDNTFTIHYVNVDKNSSECTYEYARFDNTEFYYETILR